VTAVADNNKTDGKMDNAIHHELQVVNTLSLTDSLENTLHIFSIIFIK